MQKNKILTAAILIVVLALSSSVISASSATNVPSFTVTRLSQLPINLPAGTAFDGTVGTSGVIRVWVSAPDGAQVANLGLVDEPTKISFVATKGGNYTFNFENGIVGSNPVQVSFSFTTDPDISSGDSQGLPPITLAAIAIIGIVGSVLIFVTIRRGERRKQRSKA